MALVVKDLMPINVDLTAAVPFGDGVTATDELSHVTASGEDDGNIGY